MAQLNRGMNFVDYEVINFEYHNHKCTPVFECLDPNPSSSPLLSIEQIEPQYLADYDPDQQAFMEYVVQPNDTLYGLELKYNISQSELLAINQISEYSFYPGVILKLPKRLLQASSPEIVRQKSNSYLGVNIMDEIMKAPSTKQFNVTYLTNVGSIQGIFSFSDDLLFFDPNELDKHHKFQVTIRFDDIGKTEIAEGKLKIHIKNGFAAFQSKHSQELCDLINKRCINNQAPNTENTIVTNVPYIEKHKQIDLQMKHQSELFNLPQFRDLVGQIPNVYQAGQWRRLYSSNTDGSSMNTLLRKVEGIQPVILFVKDLQNYLFGAYLSDGLRMSSGFYGTGETFLFTYRNTDRCIKYQWSQLNQDFILCDHEGIAVGCGDKYGLYINGELSGGYTCMCETFVNEQLSKSKEYEIDRIEIWTMD